jgi:hypothetical protein
MWLHAAGKPGYGMLFILCQKPVDGLELVVLVAAHRISLALLRNRL